jgi:hypothetical protein
MLQIGSQIKQTSILRELVPHKANSDCMPRILALRLQRDAVMVYSLFVNGKESSNSLLAFQSYSPCSCALAQDAQSRPLRNDFEISRAGTAQAVPLWCGGPGQAVAVVRLTVCHRAQIPLINNFSSLQCVLFCNIMDPPLMMPSGRILSLALCSRLGILLPPLLGGGL